MSKIPKKIKEAILSDPFYQECSLRGIPGHLCDGRITFEHTLIYRGKQVQEKWAIIPLCERGHAVGRFQDAGTLDKERNVWVSLNLATSEQLEAFPKVFPSYVHQRERLNNKFGPYIFRESALSMSEINY